MHSSFLLPLTLLTTLPLILANTPLPFSTFTSSPLTAIAASAPLWHFDIKTCFPTAATQPDGSQTHNLTADDCGVFGLLNRGCPVQAPQTRQEMPSTAFPTYYTVRWCEGDGSWRVVYDVFFQKDTGHPYDWEWAAVKFLPNAQGQYIRDGVYLEQDGNHPYVSWSNISSTFNNETDKSQNFNTNRDHPKIYFGKWKHNVAVTFNDDFANDCLGAVLHKKDYHSDDYQFFAADSLVPGTAVPAGYMYGKADSTPRSFEAGGVNDICGSKFA